MKQVVNLKRKGSPTLTPGRCARAFTVVRLAAVAGLLAGCAQSGNDWTHLPVQDMAGHYRKDASGSWFTPCASAPGAAPMWATLTGAAVSQYRPPAADAAARQFVRWRASVTTDGAVGPRGPGAPALMVRELIEQRAAGTADCETAAQPR